MKEPLLIKKKSSKIKISDTEDTIRVMKELFPYAKEYMDYLKKNVLTDYSSKEQEVDRHWWEEGLKNVSQHEFAIWINHQENFKQAKDRLIEKNLIILNYGEIKTPAELCKTIGLEFICASIISTHFEYINLINNSVVPQKKIDSIRRTAEKLRKQLKLIDGFIFRHESKQHILQFLLNELLADSRESVFNSGATHSKLSREFFIKKLVYLLVSIFDAPELKSVFYADLAIDVTSCFFIEEMDRSDCIALVKKMRTAREEERMFMSQTMGEYFYRSSKVQGGVN